jgi:hypothetical protein
MLIGHEAPPLLRAMPAAQGEATRKAKKKLLRVRQMVAAATAASDAGTEGPLAFVDESDMEDDDSDDEDEAAASGSGRVSQEQGQGADTDAGKTLTAGLQRSCARSCGGTDDGLQRGLL